MKQDNNIHKTQLLANALAGIALVISNRLLLPSGAFNSSVATYSYLLLTPSILLFLALFAMQYMGLVRIWAFLIVGIFLLSSFVIVFGE